MPIYVASGVTSTGRVLTDVDMYVQAYGSADKTTVRKNAALYVVYEGAATSTTVSSGGFMFCNGIAVSVNVSSGGSLRVSNGGLVTMGNLYNSGTAAGDLGAQLVKGADTLSWKYYGSVGAEWSTSLAAI